MSFGLFGHLLKQESCSFWNYSSRLLIGLAAIFVFLKVQSVDSIGAKGAVFQLIHIQFLFFLSTIAALELYSGLLHDTRQGGILGLIMMTGVPVRKFLGSIFFSKNYQLLSLLMLQIPFCLFSVTLGGVSANQILLLYLCLFCWLFMVASIYSYAGSIYSVKKEAMVINGFLTFGIFLVFAIFGLLPFSRMDQILFGPKSIDIITYNEVAYIVIGLAVWLKNLNGFEKYINSPKSFINKQKDNRRKSLLWRGASPIVIIALKKKLKFKLNDKSHPILQKDLFIYPKSSLLPFQAFPGQESVGLVLVACLTVVFSIIFVIFSGVLYFLFFISSVSLIFVLFRGWIRLVNNFKYELEDDTYMSLMTLPIKTDVLLKLKMEGCRVYEKAFWITWAVLVSSICFFKLKGGDLSNEFISSVLFVPILKSVIEKLTVIQLFRNKNSAVLSSAAIAIFTLSFYFSFTYVAICILLPLKFALPFYVNKSIEKYGSGI